MCGFTTLGRLKEPFDVTPGRWGGGWGAGGAPTASRLIGLLAPWSTPGVRFSFGMGESALGLKEGRLVREAESEA